MRCIVVYVSKHLGNTKKVAEAIADVLKCECKEISNIRADELLGYDLIFIGSGIYAWDFDKRVRSVISRISTGNGKKVALFSTSADPNGIKYHRRIREFLKLKGFEILGEYNSPGEFSFWFFKRFILNKGMPDLSDLKRARDFATSVLNKAEQGKHSP
ncbi:flavodoxin domain-containing protein [Fervidobacterium thailandense]|uniref:Flavodoxin-like domain-containing protein n=1 Tax=Fervidobacterium thailandense TaxID=1008305 RepID=A0A1E3G1I9_9BACT|nr:flavodoxin domain-containing protein [Fervidobacterium thailandense]ODN30134.1 hypothetical protein A4H02_06795 [Fervidobacterium thailandense]